MRKVIDMNALMTEPKATNPANPDRRSRIDSWIRFAIGKASLGSVLVAASAKGVCAILMGDDPDALRRNLRDRFPDVQPVTDEAGLEDMVGKVVDFIEAPGTALDLKLDMRGTEFERRVWQALGEIPVGSTATYGEIARRLGAPATAQDVAAACAANALAVAIPCHRVVNADGSVSGYRWGVRRKRVLLSREAAAAV
jgi:AraC family transcriptional regulator, regulatory protein of adaptative response / methylated-DNA-[protein]-cysteine methyltransferase